LTIDSLDKLRVKLFADGANLSEMKVMSELDHISGLTTNPTLMNKAGVKNYLNFAQDALEIVQGKPISFEVFSDELKEMCNQGLILSSLGQNVYVKVPITNSLGFSTAGVVKELSKNGVKVNLTAVMHPSQVSEVLESFDQNVPAYVSIFAGRIADTGRNPIPYVKETLQILKNHPKIELIWASPRELLNIFDAEDSGCHIITATPEILNKLSYLKYDLKEFSLDTVKMFLKDAQNSGFTIP
jgi:transaldolase